MTNENHEHVLLPRSMFKAMPGYPWLPCPICKREGFPQCIEGCDHSVLERARASGFTHGTSARH